MNDTLDPVDELTEAEPWPVELLNPGSMLARGVYDNSAPTTIGALWLVSGWAVGELDAGTNPATFRRRLQFVRDRAYELMEAHDARLATRS